MHPFMVGRVPIFLAGMILALSACSGGGEERFVNRTPDDYCQLGDASTLFLIDRTTRFDSADETRLLSSLSGVVDRLETGDRLVIATISDHYSGSKRLVSACKPGCPAPGDLMDEIVGSCSGMKAKRDQRAFMSDLAKALREIIVNAEDADGSDIIRTISFWTGAAETKRFSRVVIFSDMLENSDLISWRDFSTLPDESLISIVEENAATAKLSAANVQIIGYGRFHDADRSPLPAATDRKLRSFWSLYFGQSQSSVEFAASIE